MCYFEKLYDESRTTKVMAVKNLVSDLNFKSAFITTKKLVEQGIEHPKLAELRKIVGAEVAANKNVKIIIFNQYRESAKKIEETLGTLEGVSSRVFVGQAKKSGIGLSQKEQRAMLDSFSNGEFNCLIATSVAEEGVLNILNQALEVALYQYP